MFKALRNWWANRKYTSGNQPLWHVHHAQLLGTWEGGVDDRREDIKASKPLWQRDIRLKLLQPVKGKLPAAVLLNLKNKSWNWRENISRVDEAAVIRLHAQECDDACPMQEWNGPFDRICSSP
jgi:hypothetical protein